MPVSITTTLFGGPADGRTIESPNTAAYVDIHIAIGRALFAPEPRPATITHRYWIEKSSSGTHGIGLHAGPITEGPAVQGDALDTV